MPETTPRAIRVPDDIWHAVVEKARAEGTSATEVALAAFVRFLKRPPRE